MSSIFTNIFSFISNYAHELLFKCPAVIIKNFSLLQCLGSVKLVYSDHINIGSGSNIVNSLFENCYLKEAEFLGSYIKVCNFSGADFAEMVIKSYVLIKNTMTDAVWSSTAFHTVQFADIVFNCTFKVIVPAFHRWIRCVH